MMGSLHNTVILADAGEGWLKFIFPIIIAIFYAIAAISKSRSQSQDEAAEKKSTQPSRRQGMPQQERQPRGRVPQRPLPNRPVHPTQPGTQRRTPVPQVPARPRQVPQQPVLAQQRPPALVTPPEHRVTADRLDRGLQEELRRAEAARAVEAAKVQRVVEAPSARAVPPFRDVVRAHDIEDTGIGLRGLDLRNPAKLREAILLREILGTPLGMR